MPSAYDFLLVSDSTNVYTFTTDTRAAYAVQFKPTPYLFDDAPELGEHIYELIIELLRPGEGRAGIDARVSYTIAAICSQFLTEHQRMLLYICETADYRHLARVRKFDGWFRLFGASEFVKLDTQFPDTNGVIYFVSLVVRWKHESLHEVISAFERLSDQYQTDK